MFSSFLKERSRIGNNDCGTCDLCCFRLAFIWVYAPDKGFNAAGRNGMNVFVMVSGGAWITMPMCF